MSFSCKKHETQCLHGSLSILPFGDGNKPPHPLFIRTDETDTAYYQYDVEDNLKNMERLGYIIDKDYFYKYCMNFESFSLLKEYIMTHDTYKNYTMINGDDNTIKIVFADQCDSLTYTVNREDTVYFSNMIDFIKVNDEKLREYLSYYQSIQGWNRE
jgi:hypothetical protein